MIDHKSLLEDLFVAAVDQCAEGKERQAMLQKAKERDRIGHALEDLVVRDIEPDEEPMSKVCHD